MSIDVEAHEAGHALAAYCLGIPIKTVSVYSKDGEAGRVRPDRGAVDSSEMDFATMLVAGRLAEKRALGLPVVFNWFHPEDPDTDIAVEMVDWIIEDGGFDGDVFAARHFVELKARSLLVTKWRAAEAIAAALRKTNVLTGDDVAAICLAEAARRGARAQAAKPPPKPPAKKPGRPKRAIPPGAEVRPFTFQVVKSKEG